MNDLYECYKRGFDFVNTNLNMTGELFPKNAWFFDDESDTRLEDVIARQVITPPTITSWKDYLDLHGSQSFSFKCLCRPDITNKKENDTDMPGKFSIVDVITHNNKVVIVKFSDGTFTKSICSDDDTFDIDVGISICVLKRLLCPNGKVKEANRKYNNLMRKVHKQMEKKEADRIESIKAKKERREKQLIREKKNAEDVQKHRDQFIEDIAHGIKLAASWSKEEASD